MSNQALFIVQGKDMILQRVRNRQIVVSGMNSSVFLDVHAGRSTHVQVQEDSHEGCHTTHVGNQTMMYEHNIFSYLCSIERNTFLESPRGIL